MYKIGLSAAQYASKDGVDYRELNEQFINVELPGDDIVKFISQGHAFTVWLRDNWRKEENYICGQHLALDFDSGNTNIDTILRDKLASEFAYFIYPTLSWSKQLPRYRLLFLLDKPIMQAANYRRAAEAMLWVYGDADKKAKDPVRFFFGASQRPDADDYYIGKTLPLGKVKEIIARHEEAMKKSVVLPQTLSDAGIRGDGKALMKYWEERVSTTPKGDRNDVLNRAAYSVGELVREGKVTATDAVARLQYAAMACGLKGKEVDMTIRSGMRAAGVSL